MQLWGLTVQNLQGELETQTGDTEESQCCSSSSKVIKLEAQEKARGCSSSLNSSTAKFPLAWWRVSLPHSLQLIG